MMQRLSDTCNEDMTLGRAGEYDSMMSCSSWARLQATLAAPRACHYLNQLLCSISGLGFSFREECCEFA